MGKAFTIIIAVFGLAVTVWNTLSVEKKAAKLEEGEAVVAAMEQELENRELNYRLAVQEFNFSTLHAATAYEIDHNERLLAAGVAPGKTMLRKKDPKKSVKRVSLRSKALQQVEAVKMKAQRAALPRRREGPKPPPSPAQQPKRSLRPGSFMGRLTGKAPTPRARPTPGGRQPHPTASPRRRPKIRPEVIGLFSGSGRPVLSRDRKRQLYTIRGFQIENLSRWRQYMHVAATGEAMSEEEVDAWEDVLVAALVKAQEPALKTFVTACAESVEEWQTEYDEGRSDLQIEEGAKAVLEKQVDRGKSIYMGLMLVGLVLVTMKDVFGKGED
jgi:hypothetical protein